MEADARDPEKHVPRHFSIREGSWKVIFDENENPVELYDLSSDLAETNNLIADPAQDERIDRMQAKLLEMLAAPRTAPLPASP